ncbi:MAG TPA: dihydrofolate reductase family protein [Rhodoglobus sp.]|nr:dihydrofolate reductase family protein [Rhodoglobus sp.]
MILTRVHPGPPESLELDAASTRDRLLDLYRPAPSPTLRLNLVASISGSAAGSDGTSDTLTSRVDRRILGVIRELSDVVLVGAASVRAEGYQVPQRARLAVLTASGDLAGHRIRPDQRESVIVLAPAEARERVLESLPGAELIIVPTTGQTIAMNNVVDALHSAGFDSIVCEGGPSLAGQLIAAGLVDELCLTTSPQLGGVTLPLLATASASRAASLTQLIVDEQGYLFARWALRAP